MRKNSAYWIRKSHLFGGDEYICSNCRNIEKKKKEKCSRCGCRMTKEKYDPHWVDEMEEMDIFLND